MTNGYDTLTKTKVVSQTTFKLRQYEEDNSDLGELGLSYLLERNYWSSDFLSTPIAACKIYRPHSTLILDMNAL